MQAMIEGKGCFSDEVTRRLPENRKLTAEKPFRPIFPIKPVKYVQYSPRLIKKMDSKWLPLATASILGQSPRFKALNYPVSLLRGSLFSRVFRGLERKI